ncbi:MAG TPA: hypothetical protein EYP93_02640, partial [Gammaproteobacteria bacterium]|nr:hypothetical protein [Gammaproteobacteria bacterium]
MRGSGQLRDENGNLEEASGRGKLKSRSHLVAAAVGPKQSLLFVRDAGSGRQFLVDTGAEVSIIPATSQEVQSKYNEYKLVAANGTAIRTFGTRSLVLIIGNTKYQWQFVVATVARPLLGADFLRAH